jgi:hypothetical protein
VKYFVLLSRYIGGSFFHSGARPIYSVIGIGQASGKNPVQNKAAMWPGHGRIWICLHGGDVSQTNGDFKPAILSSTLEATGIIPPVQN